MQLLSTNDKEYNVQHAVDEIRKAVTKYKPRVVALPECFNAPYGEEFFDEYAELIPNGSTCQRLGSVAKELKIYIIGGSIPERDADNAKVLYNTATVWSPDGVLIAKHRKVRKRSIQIFWMLNADKWSRLFSLKVHLFDIDIKNVYKFTESSALTPGNNVTTFEIDGTKCGLAICYDMYFEEFAKLYRKAGW